MIHFPYLLLAVLTEVAAVVEELLLVQVNDICADVIQETLVVGHDQQGLLPVLQIAGKYQHHK